MRIKRKVLDNLINGYEDGNITSTKGIIRFFSLLVTTGRIKTLSVHYKVSAVDLMRFGYLTKKGEIL